MSLTFQRSTESQQSEIYALAGVNREEATNHVSADSREKMIEAYEHSAKFGAYFLCLVDGETLIDLDALLWKPNWTPATRQEQLAIQSELLGRDSWIIDGNYGGTLDLRFGAAETIVFLDLPRTVCTYRVLKRMLKYRGKTRPAILQRLHQLESEKDILILRSRAEVRRFVANQLEANI